MPKIDAESLDRQGNGVAPSEKCMHMPQTKSALRPKLGGLDEARSYEVGEKSA